MNNDELIEYAIRTSKVIKEEIKPKLIDYFYKQREVIDKAVEYTTKEKNNYLHHVQKAIGECIDDKGNINSNTAGLLISAAVNTCDCILDVLNGISK